MLNNTSTITRRTFVKGVAVASALASGFIPLNAQEQNKYLPSIKFKI